MSAQQDDRGVLRAHVTDAGALARFLDIYARMEGGALDLTLQQNAEGGRGRRQHRQFRAARRAGAAPTRGGGAGAGRIRSLRGPELDSSDVRFDKMSAAFTRTPGRLDLREAVIFNSSVGLTTEGYLDFAHDHVDLNGTYVPAYQVNSLVTHIPVFGSLLGGGRHEGLFGVNYRIVGPASGPTLYVNPLSAMTPGFLRKMFGAVDGTTPAARRAGRRGRPEPRLGRRPIRPPLQTARSSTCFLRPSDSLTTPEACSASRPMTARSSSSATSLTLQRRRRGSAGALRRSRRRGRRARRR